LRPYRIIDSDVHHQFPSAATLGEYLPEGTIVSTYTGGSGVPHPQGAFRRDTVTPSGGTPGSDPEFMVHDLLDRHDIEYAVLSPGNSLAFGGLPDVDLAAQLARATNDWTVDDWFSVDERFLGSILVIARDPELAVEEIRRHASNPRMVQVTITGAPCLLGHPSLHPIYEACDELGLPFNMHVGGGEAGVNGGQPLGPPTSYVEMHTTMCIPAMNHLINMVTEGVFEKFPNLTFVLNEFGIAWLPFVMWRLDMEYRAGREELPWLTRLPSQYIMDHVRFTTQPLENPEDPRDLVKLLEVMGGPRLLLFATDYPHWDADNPDTVLRWFPEEWLEPVFHQNARAVYRLEQRLGRPETNVGAA
jgi:predicted TIM-barrel fold metal-dependent hydrolase